MNKSRSRRYLIRAVWIVGIGYLSAVLTMMILEPYLVYPMPPAERENGQVSSGIFEEVWLTSTTDQTRRHGMYFPVFPPSEAVANVVYFHGNGEDILADGPLLSHLRDKFQINIFILDYPGYGLSEGSPNERDIVADAIEAAHWLADRNDAPLEKLILWGRSLGGGVVAAITPTIKPQAIILECTFDSMVDVAAGKYPWIPVQFVMRNRYPSAQALKSFSGKAIQWHGVEDRTIPLAAAERLHEAIGTTDKQFFIAPGRGHNDAAPEDFEAALTQFFKVLATKKQQIAYSH